MLKAHQVGRHFWLSKTTGEGGGGGGAELPDKQVVSEKGVTIEHYYRSGDLGGPAHLHVKGQGPPTRIGPNGLPLKGSPPLSPTQRRVVQNNLPRIKKTIRQIQKWLRQQ
jgi:hypothetical protein